MTEEQPLHSEKDSKTKRKKEMIDLQKIGEALTKLTHEQLLEMNLPDKLLTAIQELKKFTTHESRRRQFQYIGKIMRDIDHETIQQTLRAIQLVHDKHTAQFHQIEKWRIELLAQGDTALNTFLNTYPTADRQQLRQLIRKAQQDQKNNKNTGGEKALFRYLNDILKG